MTGTVTLPTPPGGAANGAGVQVCSPIYCDFSLTSGSGDYTVDVPAGSGYVTTAFAPPSTFFGTKSGNPFNVTGPAPESPGEADVELRPPPQPPPAGTEISNFGQSGGVPVLVYGQPFTLSTSGKCPGATVTFTMTDAFGNVFKTGTLTEQPPGSGNYSVNTSGPNRTGSSTVEINIDCPGGADPAPIQFNVYIDPSGYVRTTAGDPIVGATVTLLRSDSFGGPFTQVPDGDVIMSPANRKNPDQTDGTGHFGWDVIAGFYKVRATKSGCNPNESHVMTIPPPVTDLDIRLSCPSPPSGGGGGGGAQPVPQSTSAPKCKKGQKLKKGKCVKKKKKKKK